MLNHKSSGEVAVMRNKILLLFTVFFLLCPITTDAQTTASQAAPVDDSDAR